MLINNNEIDITENKITSILGNCGSGKSFYALELSKKYNYSLINDFNREPLINKLKNFNINETNPSYEDIVLIKLLNRFNDKYIVIDDMFSYLSNKNKNKVINYIRKNKITLIIITTNIEDVIYCDNVIVLDNGLVIQNGSKEEVLKNEKLLKSLGIWLPFTIDLSIQLKVYELINKIYVNNTKLVGALWKK